MSCPTCDHTMHKVGTIAETGWPLWECPRCGTTKHGHVDPVVTVPKLVERCREFGPRLRFPDGYDCDPAVEGFSDAMRVLWHRLGIAESINKPGDRL